MAQIRQLSQTSKGWLSIEIQHIWNSVFLLLSVLIVACPPQPSFEGWPLLRSTLTASLLAARRRCTTTRAAHSRLTHGLTHPNGSSIHTYDTCERLKPLEVHPQDKPTGNLSFPSQSLPWTLAATVSYSSPSPRGCALL